MSGWRWWWCSKISPQPDILIDYTYNHPLAFQINYSEWAAVATSATATTMFKPNGCNKRCRWFKKSTHTYKCTDNRTKIDVKQKRWNQDKALNVRPIHVPFASIVRSIVSRHCRCYRCRHRHHYYHSYLFAIYIWSSLSNT